MQRKQSLLALSTVMLLIALLTFMACHPAKPLGTADGKHKSAKDSSTVKKPDDGPSEFFQ